MGLEFPWEPKNFVLQRPYTAFLGKTTTGTVRISHSGARKLATIEFICCIMLLQEATIRLRVALVWV